MELIITYTVFSLVFTTGKDLQGPQDAGLNALTFMYEESGKEVMNITFVLFTKADQEAMQMNDSELMDYAKTTFFGTSKPAESYTERTIMGQNSQGEWLSVKIPVASDLEVHFITTDSGEKYCIGFKSDREMTQELRTSLITDILSSLKLSEN
jgi:hypothetical protein